MVRAAVYARVSTDDQAKEGYSLGAQLEKLGSYCEAQGWEMVDVYIDDGHSGRNIRRPEYQRMMEDREGWDILLVMKMDRIHRNSKNFMVMMENLEKWGKKFVSMQESLDTSNAMGRFVVDIIQRIAQLESEQIGERTYIGMKQKAESSKGILGFTPPFGYSIDSGRLVVEPTEAEIVDDIFGEYLRGRTMEDVARRLNYLDIPTRNGNQWTIWSVSRILRNPVYAGFLKWDGILTPDQHSPIISIQRFNKVQKLIASKTRVRKKNNLLLLPSERQSFIREVDERATT